MKRALKFLLKVLLCLVLGAVITALVMVGWGWA